MRKLLTGTYYDVSWIAERARKSKQMMDFVYKKRSKRVRNVAEMLRKRFPSITKEILSGKQGEIKIIEKGFVVLATPPRPYEWWKYDFLKADICVIKKKGNITEARRLFLNKKRESEKLRKRLPGYLRYAIPTIDDLARRRLIVAALGRGSYFGKNCYPKKKDDIDIMLLRENANARQSDYIDAFKKIPKFGVEIVQHNDAPIKKGRDPYFSFVLISDGAARYSNGNKYEKYVLFDSVGIETRHLKKEQSERVARRFARMLPKRAKKGTPALPPKRR